VKVLRILTLLILVSRFLPANHTPSLLLLETITGHVYLGDSRLPARMAYVILLPVGATEGGDAKPVASTATVQTGLDGSFLMQDVLPGTYYVAAAKLGYASPVPASYLISTMLPKS